MLERHPAIQQAAVVPMPDEIKGAKPVAFVVLRPGTSVTEEEIKQFALKNAPAYHHPRRVWFSMSFRWREPKSIPEPGSDSRKTNSIWMVLVCQEEST